MSDKLKVDTRDTVETPEGVDFQFLIAGPGKRSMSFVIDLLLKAGVLALTFFLFALTIGLSGAPSGVAAGFLLILWFAMSWLYGSCFEAFWNGQTPGKRSQNLRVVRTNGTPIGWFEAFGRNLLLVADGMLVFGPVALNTIGLLSMAGTRRMQRLGDLVFDTMVIDETREYISRAPGITHGVERLPRARCSGRYHVPERTLAVIERLFEGDRLISDGRREEIARTLSVSLKTRLGYEEPGPDPTNPNTFFVKSPIQHTNFLKQILRTFAEAEDSEIDGPEQSSGRRSANIVAEKKGVVAASVASVSSPSITAESSFELPGNFDEETSGGLPSDWRPKP